MLSFCKLALVATLALTTLTSAVPVPSNPSTSAVEVIMKASDGIKPYSDKLGKNLFFFYWFWALTHPLF
jgi:hypothetical protein